MTAFKTKNGRTVFDGGGIKPDIQVEQDDLSNLIISLIRERLFFDYATLYKYKNSSIDSVFRISDNDFASFKDFLSDKSYDYKTETEKAIEALKTTSEKENYFNLLQPQYLDLFDEFELNKKNDLDRNKQIINEILSEEISSRYFYQEGRIRTSIEYDKEIKEAIKHLKQKDLYNSILSSN